MTKITLDTDTSDCPGALCKLWNGNRSVLAQSEDNAPGIASSFGWSVSLVRHKSGCKHQGTDGSVDCQDCGTKSAAFLASAREWIDEHDGEEIEDPGYFGGDE